MKRHSLYWRIASGFVACLALLLLVQAMLFVWVVARSGSTVPNQPPERLAQTIAIDASQALLREPNLDLDQYFRQEYGRDAQPFFVLLADGRTVELKGPFENALVQEARGRLEALIRLGERRDDRGRPFGRGEPFGLRGGAGEPFDRRVPDGPWRGPRPMRPAPIVIQGHVAGLVVVPPQPPFSFLLSRYAPTLAIVALATLVLGALLAAVVIFGPARQRLRAVEDAARRLGAGDLTARAPAAGHDEVAAVAAAFNAMADDLSVRAEALAASDRLRRQLLADVSHELTTPVTAMRGYLETLSMPELGLDDATRARYLAIIGDETARLEHIIGDLLDLARLEGGGSPLVVDAAPVAQLFDRVRARHERAAADAGIAIATAIEEGAETVRADRDRLEQALQNLTANALRYAPTGTDVELRARRTAAGIAITVTDRGAGIPAEHLAHVFDRFYKTDESRAVRHGANASGGSGLGLSIVKAIVERHGGTVTVESQPGRTVFEMTIAAADQTSAAVGAPTHRSGQPGQSRPR